MKKNPKLIFKKKEVAEIFSVSTETIGKWMTKGLTPFEKEGRKLNFYLPDVIQWREGTAPEKGKLDLQEERARLAKEQADGQELKNAVTRREQAPAKLLEFALANLSEQICSILDSIPMKVKQKVPSFKASELDIIKREITKAQKAASKAKIDYSRIDELT